MEVHTSAPREVEMAGALSSSAAVPLVEDSSLRSNGARSSVSVRDMVLSGN